VVKGQLFFEASNSYTGTLNFAPDTGLPVSEKGKGHGYGLRSVLAFSKKHGASFDCQTDGEVYHVRLLIPVENG
jgi:hypothetical protein